MGLYNADAERAVLGAMMLEKAAAVRAVSLLNSEDFAQETHRILFDCLKRMVLEDKPVDVVTLTAMLGANLDRVGGVKTITDIAAVVPTAARIEHYAAIVKDCSVRRQLAGLAESIQVKIREDQDTERVLSAAQEALIRISLARPSRAASAQDVAKLMMELAETAYVNKGRLRGIPTGLATLDKMTLGFEPGQLVIVAGRPGMGKTAFALQVLNSASISGKVPSALVSLEMAKEEIAVRLASMLSGVEAKKIRSGHLRDADWQALGEPFRRLAEASFLVETGVNHLSELEARCRAWKAEYNLGLVIIDYLQLLSGPKDGSRVEEVSAISRALKRTAMNLEMPVVALAQLSRAVEDEKPPIPRLHHLRESGSIENDADIVIFLYRDEYYNPKTDKKNVCRLIVAKQRNGPTGEVEVGFDRKTGKWWDLERSE